MDARADEVLEYWFGGEDAHKRWFGGGEAVDREIRGRFGPLLEAASRGELEGWTATPRGRLAAIVILDQFSRNLFRDSPRGFVQDPLALRYTLEGIDLGHDRQLAPLERVFHYLPLEHSEDRAIQKLSLEKFGALVEEAPPDLKKSMEDFQRYAVAHARIIEAWGRYPHRNEILGRMSTPEELEFLKTPGSSF